MFAVKPCILPADALLQKYVGSGDYTDCFCLEIETAVTQAEYVQAFYTTWIFKLERRILHWFFGKASSDADARRLAESAIDGFAAWAVEARNPNQLLLSDYAGRTRSWLMTSSSEGLSRGKTRLYFGSAIVKREVTAGGEKTLGPVFRLLLGFHKIYSRLLLQAAGRRLSR